MPRQSYPALVTNNDDDEQRGRIRVSCPGLVPNPTSGGGGLLGGLTSPPTGLEKPPELPFFIEPAYDWGWFVVPDVGELVEIEVNTTSPQDESFMQFSIDNLEPTWRGKRFYTPEADVTGDVLPTTIHPSFTEENYGKRRGFATPNGHVLLFDDTEGKTKIVLTWAKEPAAASGIDETTLSQLMIDTDGTIKLSVLAKHFIHLKENEVEISLSEGASLKVVGADADAITTLGDGGVVAAIADHLQPMIEAFLNWASTHTHPTGVGPSGPPVEAGAIPAWDAAINSTKLKFPDG